MLILTIRLDDVVIVEGELGRIEEITLTYVVVKIWDKRVANIQVTDTKERYMELCILLNNADVSLNWDLRIDIREKMIGFLNKEYPDCFCKTRIQTMGYNNSKNDIL